MAAKESFPSGFRAACRDILESLSLRSGMALWMITRVNGEEWIVIDVIDKHYDVVPMRMHDWSDSFSYRMIMGLGPKVAPRVSEVPAYVNSVAYERSQIGAYIAIPLELPDGRLFGVISGVNPEPMTDELYNLLPELEVFGRCLMHIHQAENQAARLETKLAHASSPRWLDPESGALRYEAWLYDGIDVEFARINYLEPAGILYAHVPDCNGEDAEFVVETIRDFCEDSAFVYREDSENFFATLRGPDKTEQQLMAKDIRRTIEHRFPGSKCAYAYRDPHDTLTVAFQEAKKHAQVKRRKAA